MVWLQVLLGAAALTVLGIVVWISIQSILQARLLSQAAANASGMQEDGRPVAVHGRVRITAPLHHPDQGEVLWYTWTLQVKVRGYGSNSGQHWRTEVKEEKMAGIVLATQGGDVHIEDMPTEVQSTRSATVYGGGGFMASLFANERTVSKWLPRAASATAVGCLRDVGEAKHLVKSAKAGLLLSIREPAEAARVEMIKGVGGIVLVVAAVVAGLIFLVSL